MSIPLDKITFGVPAAERDNDLMDCFVSSEAYNNFSIGKKTIVLGNRGSGKSALFRKLNDDQIIKGNITINLAPEEYSYELLSETLKTEADGAWAKPKTSVFSKMKS